MVSGSGTSALPCHVTASLSEVATTLSSKLAASPVSIASSSVEAPARWLARQLAPHRAACTSDAKCCGSVASFQEPATFRRRCLLARRTYRSQQEGIARFCSRATGWRWLAASVVAASAMCRRWLQRRTPRMQELMVPAVHVRIGHVVDCGIREVDEGDGDARDLQSLPTRGTGERNLIPAGHMRRVT